MSGVGLLGAFLGGLASLLSPCSALLLPSFFAYAFDRTRLLILRTFAFWVGLCAVLVPLGAGVGALGSVVTRYRSEVTVIGGLVLIGFGLMTLLGKGFGVSGMQRLTARINISGTVSVLALGAVYGLAGFCAGPLLGAVLTMSAIALLDKSGWGPLGRDETHPMLIVLIGLATVVLVPVLWGVLRRSEGLPVFGSPTVAELDNPAYVPGIVGMKRVDDSGRPGGHR